MKTFFTSYSSQDHMEAKKESINAMIEFANQYFKDLTNVSEEVENSKKNDLLKKRQKFVEGIKLANQANQSSKVITDALDNLMLEPNQVLRLLSNNNWNGHYTPNPNSSLGKALENRRKIELNDDYNLMKKCGAAVAAVAVTAVALAVITGSAGFLGLVLAAAVIARVAYLSQTKGYEGVFQRCKNFPPKIHGGYSEENEVYDDNCRTTVAEDAFTEEELDTKMQSLRA